MKDEADLLARPCGVQMIDEELDTVPCDLRLKTRPISSDITHHFASTHLADLFVERLPVAEIVQEKLAESEVFVAQVAAYQGKSAS